ncbi:MAG: tyrosine-type recombinase/integrase [Alphaproteobacteria bacterium]
MPKARIIKAFVDQVPHTERGQIAYCDTDLPGFYLVVGSQTKTYVAQKDMQGKSIRWTIGRHGHFTPEQARKIAKEKLYFMSMGVNPNEQEKAAQAKTATLAEVLDSYKNIRKSIKDRTRQDYDYYTGKYLPDWLNLRMSDINKNMVVERHAYIGENHGKIVANGTMRILRALFNHANVQFEICEINPVVYLSKIKAWYPEKRRHTYIKPHDLKKWWDAVYALENDTYRDFFLMLLFTGLRRGEASRLRWTDIDFKGRSLTVSDTKNGDALTLPLSAFLYDLLEERRKRYGNYEYIFPGTGKHGFLHEPKKGVQKVIERSGVEFMPHDLRRTYVSIAEGLEVSHYVLKKLLNHRQADITGSYVIISLERLRGPVEKIAKYILEQVDEGSLRGDSQISA